MRNLIITGGISLLVGFGIGYWFVPTNVVEKVVHVDKVNKKKNITVVIVKKPDGTVTTTKVDKTTTDTDNSTSNYKEIKKDNLNWLVTGYYTRNIDKKSEILVSIHRRLFGEVYVGIIGSNRGFGGVGVTIRF